MHTHGQISAYDSPNALIEEGIKGYTYGQVSFKRLGLSLCSPRLSRIMHPPMNFLVALSA